MLAVATLVMGVRGRRLAYHVAVHNTPFSDRSLTCSNVVVTHPHFGVCFYTQQR